MKTNSLFLEIFNEINPKHHDILLTAIDLSEKLSSDEKEVFMSIFRTVIADEESILSSKYELVERRYAVIDFPKKIQITLSQDHSIDFQVTIYMHHCYRFFQKNPNICYFSIIDKDGEEKLQKARYIDFILPMFDVSFEGVNGETVSYGFQISHEDFLEFKTFEYKPKTSSKSFTEKFYSGIPLSMIPEDTLNLTRLNIYSGKEYSVNKNRNLGEENDSKEYSVNIKSGNEVSNISTFPDGSVKEITLKRDGLEASMYAREDTKELDRVHIYLNKSRKAYLSFVFDDEVNEEVQEKWINLGIRENSMYEITIPGYAEITLESLSNLSLEPGTIGIYFSTDFPWSRVKKIHSTITDFPIIKVSNINIFPEETGYTISSLYGNISSSWELLELIKRLLGHKFKSSAPTKEKET